MNLKKTSSLPLRCLCLPEESLSHIMKRVKKIKHAACDLVEVGISSMQKTEWESALAHIQSATKLPLVLASRGEKVTQETLKIYEAAVDAGWEWLDVDMSSPKKYIQQLIEKMKKRSSKKSQKLILSTHLKSASSASIILKKIEQIRALGKKVTTIPKVVTVIAQQKNVLTLLQVITHFKKKNISVILHGTGAKSRESRLLQATGGSAITYLCLESKLATAKGQWTIEDWNRTIYANRRSSRTRPQPPIS